MILIQKLKSRIRINIPTQTIAPIIIPTIRPFLKLVFNSKNLFLSLNKNETDEKTKPIKAPITKIVNRTISTAK